MSRLNGTIMGMRAQRYVLATMETGAESSHSSVASKKMDFDVENQLVSIQLNEVTLGYEALEKPVIEGLNHTFESGKLHAIVGPSGSGSTLISSMLGLHHTEQGTVKVRFAAKSHPKSLERTSASTTGY